MEVKSRAALLPSGNSYKEKKSSNILWRHSSTFNRWRVWRVLLKATFEVYWLHQQPWLCCPSILQSIFLVWREKGKKKSSKRSSTNIPKKLVIHSKHNSWMSSPFSDLLTDLRAMRLWHSVDNLYHFGSMVNGMNNALL